MYMWNHTCNFCCLQLMLLIPPALQKLLFAAPTTHTHIHTCIRGCDCTSLPHPLTAILLRKVPLYPHSNSHFTLQHGFQRPQCGGATHNVPTTHLCMFASLFNSSALLLSSTVNRKYGAISFPQAVIGCCHNRFGAGASCACHNGGKIRCDVITAHRRGCTQRKQLPKWQ